MKLKFLLLAVIIGTTPVLSQAHELTPETRKQKVELYQKMSEQYKLAAFCLESGKSLDDCNAEAMKACPMVGKDCPFTEKGHMDKEKMREHMKKMKDAPEKTST
jgi:hypothetical protein